MCDLLPQKTSSQQSKLSPIQLSHSADHITPAASPMGYHSNEDCPLISFNTRPNQDGNSDEPLQQNGLHLAKDTSCQGTAAWNKSGENSWTDNDDNNSSNEDGLEHEVPLLITQTVHRFHSAGMPKRRQSREASSMKLKKNAQGNTTTSGVPVGVDKGHDCRNANETLGGPGPLELGVLSTMPSVHRTPEKREPYNAQTPRAKQNTETASTAPTKWSLTEFRPTEVIQGDSTQQTLASGQHAQLDTETCFDKDEHVDCGTEPADDRKLEKSNDDRLDQSHIGNMYPESIKLLGSSQHRGQGDTKEHVQFTEDQAPSGRSVYSRHREKKAKQTNSRNLKVSGLVDGDPTSKSSPSSSFESCNSGDVEVKENSAKRKPKESYEKSEISYLDSGDARREKDVDQGDAVNRNTYLPPMTSFPCLPESVTAASGCFTPMLAAAAAAMAARIGFPPNPPAGLFSSSHSSGSLTNNPTHPFLPPHGLFMNPGHFDMLNEQMLSEHLLKPVSEGSSTIPRDPSPSSYSEGRNILLNSLTNGNSRNSYEQKSDLQPNALNTSNKPSAVGHRGHVTGILPYREGVGDRGDYEEDIGDDEMEDTERAEECESLEAAVPTMMIGETSDAGKTTRPGGHQWTFEEQFKQLYILSDDPKRKEFLDELFAYMQRRGTPVNRIPIMAKQVLDLYELFQLVIARGGLVEVINKKMWREITKGLNLPSSITSAAFTLRTQYMKYLYPYECDTHGLSTPAELQSAIDGNRREARRSSYSFEYPMILSSSNVGGTSQTLSPSGGLLGNHHTPPGALSNSMLGSSTLEHSSADSEAYLPPSLHSLLPPTPTVASVLPQAFPAGLLPFGVPNSLAFPHHLNPLFGITPTSMTNNPFFNAQQTSKAVSSAPSSTGALHSGPIALSNSSPMFTAYPTSPTLATTSVPGDSQRHHQTTHMHTSLENGDESNFLPSSANNSIRGPLAPTSSTSSVVSTALSFGRPSTTLQNTGLKAASSTNLTDSSAFAAAAAASLFGVGFPGFPGNFPQLGESSVGLLPQTTPLFAMAQSLGNKNQMKISPKSNLMEGSDKPEAPGPIKLSTTLSIDTNCPSTGTEVLISNQPLNLAASEASYLQFFNQESCRTLDHAKTKDHSNERIAEIGKVSGDLSTKRSSTSRRQSGRRHIQKGIEQNTFENFDEYNEEKTDGDCDRINNDDQAGEPLPPGLENMSSPGYRPYSVIDSGSSQMVMPVSEPENGEAIGSSKVFTTSLHSSNAAPNSSGSPEKELIDDVSNRSENLAQQQFYNHLKRCLPRGVDTASPKLPRVMNNVSETHTTSSMRRTNHTAHSSGARKSSIASGMENRKVPVDPLVSLSSNCFPSSSSQNGASDVGGITQNLLIHTQPGSPMGLPRNAIVVTMEMANILYQGVLFGQMKR